MSEAIDPAGAGEGLTELRRSLGGAVLAPADDGFDAARRCFNALVDRRPAVIVRCLDADDVRRAFDFARAHALEVAPYAEVGTIPPDTASARAAW